MIKNFFYHRVRVRFHYLDLPDPPDLPDRLDLPDRPDFLDRPDLLIRLRSKV